MPLTKSYLKSKSACKVTFKLAADACEGSKTLCLVGEFNDWNTRSHPMKRLKDGSFSLSVQLAPGREYQYRFLTDSGRWLNDTAADRYEFSAFAGGDNSVVSV